jgi:hypothetical protein
MIDTGTVQHVVAVREKTCKTLRTVVLHYTTAYGIPESQRTVEPKRFVRKKDFTY